VTARIPVTFHSLMHTEPATTMRFSVLLLLLTAFPASAQDGLKVYISADMEGVTGVVTGEQLGPEGFEYARFRQFMTDEVNACIEAAREAGATEFMVSDSHGNGQNLLIERLPPDVLVIRSWPRELGMMAGIDETFDAAIFIGYHASTSNAQGVRAHTMSSANVTDLRLNGISVPEAAWNAAIAGQFGVPVVMISGDDVIATEAGDLLGDVETAVVKWSRGFHSATTMTPEAGLEVIREKTRSALARVGDFRPYRVASPPIVELSLKNYRPVELLGYLRGVERIGSHTIRYQARDMVDASNFLAFVLGYSVSLTP